MFIRDCRTSDIEECKRIWIECFPEDIDFCDYYFENVHPFGRAVVCEAKDGIASYLNILPFTADSAEKSLKCSYIYGVSTDIKHRKMGYMTALLNHAHKLCINDEFSFLIPSISGVYEKFGYKTISQKRRVDINFGGNDCSVCNDLQHLNMIYNEYRKKFDLSLKRSKKWWEFIYHTAVSDGFRFIANDGAYAVVCEDEILEIAYVSDDYRDRLSISGAVLTLPKVMARGNFDFHNNYIAMMLD